MNRRLRLASMLTGALVALSACGALGAADPAPSGTDKAAIRISMMTAMDAAPFYYALDHGYFDDAGLMFPQGSILVAASGGESVGHLLAGQVDIAFGSYPPFLLAQDKSVADLKFLVDGTSAAPNTSMLMVAKNSRIKNVRDLAGARIGITARGTLSEMLPRYYLDKIAGVDIKTVQWVEIGFDKMAAALAAGQLDAASVVEPFITAGAREQGIVPLQDVAVGPNADFPVTGYGTTATWAQNHKDLAEKFRTAMTRAVRDLTTDPGQARAVLQRHTKISSDVLAIAALPRYESDLDPNRLDRAVRLMDEFEPPLALAHVTSTVPMILQPTTGPVR